LFQKIVVAVYTMETSRVILIAILMHVTMRLQLQHVRGAPP
jgi:hypothetical protein